MSSYHGINDPYLPAISKPSLQQWDNYQIYDLICSDTPNASNTVPITARYWLAVEKVSPHESIPINFTAIALMYP